GIPPLPRRSRPAAKPRRAPTGAGRRTPGARPPRRRRAAAGTGAARTRLAMKIRSAPAILAVLTGVNVLNYADRYVGAAMLPLILAGLGLTDAEGGLMQSAFILSYSIVSPLAGWLGDRWARLRLATVGIFTWSAATVASGLAPNFAALLAARAVIGVGE